MVELLRHVLSVMITHWEEIIITFYANLFEKYMTIGITSSLENKIKWWKPYLD